MFSRHWQYTAWIDNPFRMWVFAFYFLLIINRTAVMETSRRLGILVFCGVPAIVGGGIVYAIFGDLTAMWIYEALLAVTAGSLVSR